MKIAAEESNLRTKESPDDHLADGVEGERANDQSRYEYPTVFGFCSNCWQDQSHDR
jgi:hypothetical protein